LKDSKQLENSVKTFLSTFILNQSVQGVKSVGDLFRNNSNTYIRINKPEFNSCVGIKEDEYDFTSSFNR